jgi:hypothetical protein
MVSRRRVKPIGTNMMRATILEVVQGGCGSGLGVVVWFVGFGLGGLASRACCD